MSENEQYLPARLRKCARCGADNMQIDLDWHCATCYREIIAERDEARNVVKTVESEWVESAKKWRAEIKFLRNELEHYRKIAKEAGVYMDAIMSLAEGLHKPGEITAGDPRWSCTYATVELAIAKLTAERDELKWRREDNDR